MQVPSSAGKSVSDSQEGFAGGESPQAGSGIAGPSQYAAVTNMRLVRNGEMAKRPGLRSMGTVGTNSERLHPSTLNSAARTLALNGPSRSAKKIAVVGTGITVTSLSNLAVTDYVGTYHSAQFRDATSDVLYVGTIGVTPSGLIKWDGTTLTEGIASSFVTNISTLWVYNQRLFGCKGIPPGLGGGAATQTLYWSGLDNGDTLGDVANGGGFATIRTYGGQNIVGGFALGNSNFILHESAISVFRGTTFDDIDISAGAQGVSPNIGRPRGWKVIDQVGYVLTEEGLFLVTEAGGVRSAGTSEFPDPIRTFLATTTDDFEGGTWDILDNARRREVWCCVRTHASAGTGTTRVFIWNVDLGRFTGQCQYALTLYQGLVINDSNGGIVPAMMGGTGALYGFDWALDSNQVYQDNSSSYTSSVRLRRMYSQQSPSTLKAWRSLDVQMGSGAGQTPVTSGSTTGAKVSYTNSAGTVADTTDLLAQQTNTIQVSGQGNSIDVTITDLGASSTGWSVLRAEVLGSSYGGRGG